MIYLDPRDYRSAYLVRDTFRIEKTFLQDDGALTSGTVGSNSGGTFYREQRCGVAVRIVDGARHRTGVRERCHAN